MQVLGIFAQFASVEAQAKDHRLKCVLQGVDEEPSTHTGEALVEPTAGAVSPPSVAANSSRGSSSHLIAPTPSPSPYSTHTGAAGGEYQEEMQRELQSARQQIQQLATRNQELSQRLAAVEQSV